MSKLPIFTNSPSSNTFGDSFSGFVGPVFADIDGDGDLDAFMGERYGETLFFRNDGTALSPGLVAVNDNLGITDVGDLSNPAFVDIDGDGDLDAFVGEIYGETLFFRNNGTVVSPSFSAETSNIGLTDVGGNASPTFADIDGDGDFDGFIGDREGITHYFRNDGTALHPSFVEASGIGLIGVGYNAQPAFADLDQDGDLDAFIGAKNGKTTFYRNDGTVLTPNFTVVAEGVDLSIQGTYANPTFADIDGDGDMDAFIGRNYDGGHVDFFVNAETATLPHFNPPSGDAFGLSQSGINVVASFVDIDKDGDLDAFVGDEQGFIRFFQNTGNANTPVFATGVENPFGLTDATYHAAPTFADIDGDGDLDAFVGDRYGSLFRFSENIGTATEPAFTASTLNPFGLSGSSTGAYVKPSFADLDGDGDVDLLVGNSEGELLYFSNTGTADNPAFAAAVKNPFGLKDVGNSASPTFADIDDDGDFDLLVGNRDGNLFLFQNIGDANNPVFAAKIKAPFGLTAVNANAKPSLADIDGDGDLDAFVGSLGHGLQFYLNQAPQPSVIIKQTGGSTSVTEGGVTDKYTVVLNTQPSADVTITLNTTNQQVSVANVNLTFTPANWNIAQTVTVSAQDDNVGEGAHQGVIQHVASSTDTDYNGLTITPVTVAIRDNDLIKGNPQFIQQASNPFGLSNVGSYTNNPTFADIDADGDLDAFIGTFKQGIMFFDNIGTAKQPVFAEGKLNPFKLKNVGDYMRPIFADVDNDGDLDAFIGVDKGSTLFFQNIGSAQHAEFTKGIKNPFGIRDIGTNASPTLADIDGDGDMDLFIGGNYGGLDFFRNISKDGTIAFEAKANPFGITNTGAYIHPTFADVDGDGDLDAFIGNSYSELRFYQNTGDANNPVFTVSVVNPFGLTNLDNYPNPSFADIDSDGDLDLFVGNDKGDTLFFVNNQAPRLTQFVSPVESIKEDKTVTMTFAELKDKGNEADADSVVSAFVVTSISSGSLKIGSSAVTATDWAVGSNDVIDASHRAFWTPAADANGLLSAFAVLAKDNQGSTSTTPVSVNVAVTAVNDVPVGAVNITGQATQGAKLSASNTLSDADGLGAISYTWKVGAQVLATGATYRLKASDVGTKITVTASYTDDDGTVESIKSVPTKLIGLVKTGTNKAETLTGTKGDDQLNGAGGNDTLNGGQGNDDLTGGAGNDTFRFDSVLSNNTDVIQDFNVADDSIQLENSVFSQLTAGVLKNANFKIGAAASDANDFIIYQSATGDLFYDADGNGASETIKIAVLGTNLALTTADFSVI